MPQSVQSVPYWQVDCQEPVAPSSQYPSFEAAEKFETKINNLKTVVQQKYEKHEIVSTIIDYRDTFININLNIEHRPTCARVGAE